MGCHQKTKTNYASFILTGSWQRDLDRRRRRWASVAHRYRGYIGSLRWHDRGEARPTGCPEWNERGCEGMRPDGGEGPYPLPPWMANWMPGVLNNQKANVLNSEESNPKP